MLGIAFKSLAAMRVIRNHQRKNERWGCFLFYTNYTVNLSGNIKYHRPNLKRNYVAQLIGNEGDGHALYFIFIGRFEFYWICFFYYQEGLIVQRVSSPIFSSGSQSVFTQ